MDWEPSLHLFRCFGPTKWACLFHRVQIVLSISLSVWNVWFCNFFLLSFSLSCMIALLFLSWVKLTPQLRNHFVKSRVALEHHNMSMVSGNYENQFRPGFLFGLWWDHIDSCGFDCWCFWIFLVRRNFRIVIRLIAVYFLFLKKSSICFICYVTFKENSNNIVQGYSIKIQVFKVQIEFYSLPLCPFNSNLYFHMV